ncbi:hypothetical protein PFISCL1PPCAC_18209, partial [Pristionchus fissidentatus]
ATAGLDSIPPKPVDVLSIAQYKHGEYQNSSGHAFFLENHKPAVPSYTYYVQPARTVPLLHTFGSSVPMEDRVLMYEFRLLYDG